MQVEWRVGGGGRARRYNGGRAGGAEGRGGGERRAGGRGSRREGGREGRVGQRGRRKFYLRAELIKCIDPNEGEALKRGRDGRERGVGEEAGGREGGRKGRGRGGGKKFYMGVELIKCIDPNEGEALRRGSTFKPGGLAPLPPCSTAYGGGGGSEDIGL